MFRSNLWWRSHRTPRVLATSAAAMVVFALTLAGHASAGQGRVAPASRLVEYRALPIDVCVPLDRKTAHALDSGRAQLLLRLQNQRFVRRYSPPFNVYLYDADRHQRIPVHTFSMQSDIASRANSALPIAQTFSIDLRGVQLATRKAGPLCIALELEREAESDRDQGQAEGAGHPHHPQAKPTDRLRVSLSIKLLTP